MLVPKLVLHWDFAVLNLALFLHKLLLPLCLGLSQKDVVIFKAEVNLQDGLTVEDRSIDFLNFLHLFLQEERIVELILQELGGLIDRPGEVDADVLDSGCGRVHLLLSHLYKVLYGELILDVESYHLFEIFPQHALHSHCCYKFEAVSLGNHEDPFGFFR